MKLVSVIIVTYNSDELIDDCLHSLEEYNDIGEQLEVIIVDNCSKNAHSFLNKINTTYPYVKTFSNNNNAGYGAGNNYGIKKATAPIILIMNPDVRLKEPIFKRALCKFSSDLEVKVLGMKQWKSKHSKGESYFCDCLLSDFYTIFIDKLLNRLNIYMPKFHYFSGACFFLRRKEFEQIGMFDERIFLYGEEVDIKHRFQCAFGLRSYKYAVSLNYIHLIQGRISSQKSFDCFICSLNYLCQKYGYNYKNVLQQQRRIYYTLMFLNRIIRNKDKSIHFQNYIRKLNTCIESIANN